MKRELARVEKGRGKRYPAELRVRVVRWAQRRRAAGASWQQLKRELGQRFDTVRRWCTTSKTPTTRVLRKFSPETYIGTLSRSPYVICIGSSPGASSSSTKESHVFQRRICVRTFIFWRELSRTGHSIQTSTKSLWCFRRTHSCLSGAFSSRELLNLRREAEGAPFVTEQAQDPCAKGSCERAFASSKRGRSWLVASPVLERRWGSLASGKRRNARRRLGTRTGFCWESQRTTGKRVNVP